LKPFDLKLRHTLDDKLTSKTPQEFEQDFRKLVCLGHNLCSIVYTFNSSKAFPRLRGASRIIYIGKTIRTMPQRYTTTVKGAETKNYWKRYEYIINNYGPITIDLYPSDDPGQAENDFLFDYFEKHLEAPPLNTANFKTSRLSTAQLGRFYVQQGNHFSADP